MNLNIRQDKHTDTRKLTSRRPHSLTRLNAYCSSSSSRSQFVETGGSGSASSQRLTRTMDNRVSSLCPTKGFSVLAYSRNRKIRLLLRALLLLPNQTDLLISKRGLPPHSYPISARFIPVLIQHLQVLWQSRESYLINSRAQWLALLAFSNR
jgi:hypothetical protein